MSSYFSHDSNARHDAKLMALRAEFDGDVRPYAWFFMLLEIMREKESDGYLLDLAPLTKKGLTLELGITLPELDRFLETALEIELFHLTEDGKLYSESFLNRMEQKDEISRKRREAATKRWKQATGKKPKEEEKSDNTPSNEEQVYEAWNKAGIVRHRQLTSKARSRIKTALRDFTLPELLKAIANYGKVVNGSQYYFKYRWALEDFLSRGISKFVDDSCFKNFKSDDKNTPYKEDDNAENEF